MNKYELAVVVNGQLDEEQRLAVLENCKELVGRFGGTITNVEDWGKKKLAYEIQKMDEGYYSFIQFDAESSAIAEIESRMRIMDNVLRYLCVKQNPDLQAVQAKKEEENVTEQAEEEHSEGTSEAVDSQEADAAQTEEESQQEEQQKEEEK